MANRSTIISFIVIIVAIVAVIQLLTGVGLLLNFVIAPSDSDGYFLNLSGILYIILGAATLLGVHKFWNMEKQGATIVIVASAVGALVIAIFDGFLISLPYILFNLGIIALIAANFTKLK